MASRWRLSSCQIKYPCRYVKPWKMCFSPSCISGYVGEEVRPVFESGAQNNEAPIPKKCLIQTHKHQHQMPESATERAYEGPVQWDNIKYGKFVALQNCSVQLLGMCGFILICHEENWQPGSRPLLRLSLSHDGLWDVVFKIQQASSSLSKLAFYHIALFSALQGDMLHLSPHQNAFGS